MRIMVTGPRNLRRVTPLRAALRALTEWVEGPHTLIHGSCPEGADHLFAAIATGWHWTVEAYEADWDHCEQDCPPGHRVVKKPGDRFHPGLLPDYCPKAGPRRNALMVGESEADVCVPVLMDCVWPKCRTPKPHMTHGTGGCLKLAKAAGIPIYPIDLRNGALA